jgi:Protein of unknown function (DUF2510)
MTTQPPPPAPGWYPDPAGGPGKRWWDGTTWGPFAPPPQPARRKNNSTPALLILVLLLCCGGCGAFALFGAATRHHHLGHFHLGTGTDTTAPSAPSVDTLAQIDGTYVIHYHSYVCDEGGDQMRYMHDFSVTVTHQGNSLTMQYPTAPFTGTVNGDGSYVVSNNSYAPAPLTWRGVFTGGGIRDGSIDAGGGNSCHGTFTATKQ